MRGVGLALGLSACVLLVGCEAKYQPKKLLKEADAWACVDEGKNPDKCEGRSVELEGYVTDYTLGEYEIQQDLKANSPAFRTAEHSASLTEGAKVRIRGLIVDSGFIGTHTTVEVHDSEELIPAPRREPTAEEIIARNREMGRKALEEADVAIRANNADMKRSLAAKAVAHHVRNSGDTLIDVYQMRDGRIIGCKTVVYPSSAPITSCDGEP
jgi:hypothetical protein